MFKAWDLSLDVGRLLRSARHLQTLICTLGDNSLIDWADIPTENRQRLRQVNVQLSSYGYGWHLLVSHAHAFIANCRNLIGV